jgi:hypothetical protein
MEKLGSSQLVSFPIENAVFGVYDETFVNTPAVFGIFCDKLKAFTPDATGVPFKKNER